MAKDIYGFDRTFKAADQIVSSEHAVVRLGSSSSNGAGGSGIDLVQQCNANYEQTVGMRSESGSSQIYWQVGQARGQVAFSRLVGKDGFFARFGSVRDICGKTLPITLSLGGSGACKNVQVKAGSSIEFAEAVPSRVDFGWQTQSQDVTEGLTLYCAFMDVK